MPSSNAFEPDGRTFAGNSSDPSQSSGELDPVYVHSRREAWLILGVWTLAMLWTLGAYWLLAHGPPGELPQFIFGMPSWVVWGVLTPWSVATLFSIWFAQSHMVLDDLGEDEEAVENEEVRRD